MTLKIPLAMDINLRTRAWGLFVDSRNLYLSAVHNRVNQVRFKGSEILEDYKAKTDEEVKDVLDEFLSKNGVKRGDALMVLPRSQVMIQTAEFPPEAGDSLDEVLQYQLGNYFPGNLDEMEFFPQIIHRGDLLKVMIVAIRKERLGEAFALLRRWNIKLAGIGLETFALVNGLLKTQAERVGDKKIVIFNFLDEGIELIGFVQGRLVSSFFIEINGDTERQQAVFLLEEGFSQARLSPNEVDLFLWSGNFEGPLAAWRTYLIEELGFPVHPWSESDKEDIPASALGGFGGAVTSLHDKVPLTLNMLPEKLRKRRRQLPLILASFAAVLVLAFFLVGEIRDYRDLLDKKNQLDRQVKQVESRMLELGKVRAEQESLLAEREMFKRYQADHMIQKLLFTLTEKLPDDTYLTNLQIKNSTELTLQGESEDPFRTQRLLIEVPFLRDVSPGNAITPGRNRDNKKRFMFRATIILEALK